MTARIAIVGMACRYPDARSPDELWDNVLAQRRAFRTIPDERLCLADYLSTDGNAPDCFYSTKAALIEGYEFDRTHFRVAGSTYRTTDPSHWLALDIAAQALDDAGFTAGVELPRETTGVFLGNTLTGEVSRANALRLRWPFVRRVIEQSIASEGCLVGDTRDFLETVEANFKEPFPPIDEDSLAGGLSNTIAGRICNYFDLKGGGYTVDGACASSLLAVANACSALTMGDLDVALAGGVDLSLDPFELVGFAKAGALARDEMRVYDAKSNGFWPGEGCGVVVLMRHENAVAQGRRIYAIIKGWGISSDGHGGMIRPEIEGQLLAIRRAYARACFGVETVAYFEGHGTGTSVGDAVELKALSFARREAGIQTFPAAIGSIKANIGHTKAAAGVAGLIKATLALNAGIIPPTTGCEEPHEELTSQSTALRVLKKGEPWPKEQALRAGVSSMGFGGINAHVVLEADEKKIRSLIGPKERVLISSAQDTELFLLGAQSLDALRAKVDHLLSIAPRLSRAELSDVAARLSGTLGNHDIRAAVVAATPSSLAERLDELRSIIECRMVAIKLDRGVFFSANKSTNRIGFLFPGQGSPLNLDGGALRRRFDFVEELYAKVRLEGGEDQRATVIAQPAIITASIAALRVLERLNVSAQVAIGHSLGELTAYYWSGAIQEEALLRIATVRGEAIAESGASCGAMASISASESAVLALLNGDRVVIAGLNAPKQTVISGDAAAIDEVLTRARAQNVSGVKLPVSHAFHSPLLSRAAPILATYLTNEQFKCLDRKVVSTITGEPLLPDANLSELLYRQITSPVRFMEAVIQAEADGLDLWLEIGPGSVLGGIMSEIKRTPVISVDSGGSSLNGLLCAVGAAYVLGQPVNHRVLFEDRFTRSFDLNWQPNFLVNPCELGRLKKTTAARVNTELRSEPIREPPTAKQAEHESEVKASIASSLALVTQLVAERAELPVSQVNPHDKLLSDLHLNSITVGQLVGEAARCLNLPLPVSPTDFADARVFDLAQALDDQMQLGHAAGTDKYDPFPAGIDSWVRPFVVELVERPQRSPHSSGELGEWQVLAAYEDPFVASVRSKFADCAKGSGIVICLPHEPDEAIIGLLLRGAKMVLQQGENAKFVLAQSGQGAAAFARTFHLETPQLTTCVLNVPRFHSKAADWVLSEALTADGYVEAHYDETGRRYEPVVRPLAPLNKAKDLGLSTEDVLLVSGGGKGITAECALALAKKSGVRLVLIGRSEPERDDELLTNLQRMNAEGIDFRYISADVTDTRQITETIRRVEEELGPITAILHGAGINVPQPISSLDEDAFRRTLAVKFEGARNLLATINPEKLRLLITFSSIIARTGLPGEADYGVANEWLTHLTEEWKLAHPSCRCLALEWSVWSGSGMGERLGRTDRLAQEGITPISPTQGVATLLELLTEDLPSVPVVVMGRFRDLPTFKIERPELPLLRFLQETRLYFPGIELVVDAEISTSADLYLNDHLFKGGPLLPAVMGLEAMAQAASALIGSTQLPVLEQIRFNRPVFVPKTDALKIRLLALVRAPQVVEVALRCAETAFQVDHFQATCRFEKSSQSTKIESLDGPEILNSLRLAPDRDLYGNILFQSGRFQRIKNYRLLRATECIAELINNGNKPWFNQYLPEDLLLGNPGSRDAALHAVQACIPHKTLLPIACERLSIEALPSSESLFVHARERRRDGDSFTYDLETISNGQICERWEGLQLRSVDENKFAGPWVECLLSAYLEGTIQQFIPGNSLSVALVNSTDAPRHKRSNEAMQMALGEEAEILRRPNGRPYVRGRRNVSAAHSNELTFAVAGLGPLACDIEPVVERTESAWRDLLGNERCQLADMIVRNSGDASTLAATRVWAASECLKKMDAMIGAPLLFESSTDEGWVVLSAGRITIVTYAAQILGSTERSVLAVAKEVPLQEGPYARL